MQDEEEVKSEQPVADDKSVPRPLNLKVHHGVIEDEDDYLPPEQRRAAYLLANGVTIARVAKEIARSERTIWRWKSDPTFAREIALIRDTVKSSSDGAGLAVLPKAVMKAAEMLDDPDVRIRAKGIELIFEYNERLFDKQAITMVSADGKPITGVGPAIHTHVAPPVSHDIDSFWDKDLAQPHEGLYRRNRWLLQVMERTDIRDIKLKIGKGAGKTTLGAAFLARRYQRLCALARPSEFFGLLPGHLVGLVNLSVTQNQAQLAVWHDYCALIDKSPWFRKHAETSLTSTHGYPNNGQPIRSVCGSSNSKAVEGVNIIYGVADEVCRLAETENASEPRAEDLVRPVRYTMVTRFPKWYQMMILSWPSHLGDYMHQQIEESIRSGIKEDLTDEFLSVPISYDDAESELSKKAWDKPPFNDPKYRPFAHVCNDGSLVVGGPTWAFKPWSQEMEDEFVKEAAKNSFQFSRMIGAAPERKGENPLIRDMGWVKAHADKKRQHPMDPEDRFIDSFKGSGEHLYFAAIDVGIKHDAAGIAVAHFENGQVFFDLVLEVKPPEGGEIRIAYLESIVGQLARRGFTIAKVRQDGFQGIAVKQDFESSGIPSEIFSVDRTRKAYDTLIEALYSGRLNYYDYGPMYQCFESLVDLGHKIDHTPNGKKDVTDAMASCAHMVLEEMGMLDGMDMGHIE